jgi:hypothetical protein
MTLEDLFRVQYAWPNASSHTLATKNALVQAWRGGKQVAVEAGVLTDAFLARWIVQVKGWKSGMKRADYEAMSFPDPTWNTPSFFQRVSQIIIPLLRHIPVGSRVYVQWDGAGISDGSGSYGIFVIAIAMTLAYSNMFAGFLCMALAEKDSLHSFVDEYVSKRGGHLLFECFPMHLVLFITYSFDDKSLFDKGVYGSIVNKLFSIANKVVFAFGGEDELNEEELRGYTNTMIFGIPLTRTIELSNGLQLHESSSFANRHNYLKLYSMCASL